MIISSASSMLFLTKQGIDTFNERPKTPDSFLLRSGFIRETDRCGSCDKSEHRTAPGTALSMFIKAESKGWSVAVRVYTKVELYQQGNSQCWQLISCTEVDDPSIGLRRLTSCLEYKWSYYFEMNHEIYITTGFPQIVFILNTKYSLHECSLVYAHKGNWTFTLSCCLLCG